jgi:hypothetical protein
MTDEQFETIMTLLKQIERRLWAQEARANGLVPATQEFASHMQLAARVELGISRRLQLAAQKEKEQGK